MANRNFNRKQALEKEVKDLYAEVAIGASGAPTLTSSVGIASIAKNSTGDYTLTLQDAYNSLKFAQIMFLDSSAQDIRAQLKAEDVAGDKTIDFLTLTAATPTHPASGQVLLIKLELKNSSAV